MPLSLPDISSVQGGQLPKEQRRICFVTEMRDTLHQHSYELQTANMMTMLWQEVDPLSRTAVGQPAASRGCCSKCGENKCVGCSQKLWFDGVKEGTSLQHCLPVPPQRMSHLSDGCLPGS